MVTIFDTNKSPKSALYLGVYFSKISSKLNELCAKQMWYIFVGHPVCILYMSVYFDTHLSTEPATFYMKLVLSIIKCNKIYRNMQNYVLYFQCDKT